MQFAVIVVDADDADGFNPAAALSYEEYDVLWTRTECIAFLSSGAGSAEAPVCSFPIDIKVKRKLKRDDFVYFVFANNTLGGYGTGDITPNLTARALLVPK